MLSDDAIVTILVVGVPTLVGAILAFGQLFERVRAIEKRQKDEGRRLTLRVEGIAWAHHETVQDVTALAAYVQAADVEFGRLFAEHKKLQEAKRARDPRFRALQVVSFDDEVDEESPG